MEVSGVSVLRDVCKQGICVFSIDNHVNHFPSLVSTYVVCERLSAMQGLPESSKAKFVLKLARTPYSGIWSRIPHPHPSNPGNEKVVRSWLGTLSFDYYRTLPTPKPQPPPPIEY